MRRNFCVRQMLEEGRRTAYADGGGASVTGSRLRIYERRRTVRTRHATGSKSPLAALFGLSLLIAIAALMFAFSRAAAAAVTTPLVSTATSTSGGGSVGNGTVLRVTFNEAPILASSYSLTLADGAHAATLSSTAGTLSAAANGTTIAFTVHGSTSLSASVLEIVGSTGVNDASGNPWDLVASGQVDKAFVLAAGDQVTVNYNRAVIVAPSYSLTLTEGSGSAVVDNGNSTVSGSGTATLVFTLTGDPSGSVAADGPTVTSSTGITATLLPVTPAPVVTSDSVNIALSTACTNVGVTRVFGGSNCDIGFNRAGPVAPDVYDVIPLPTQDLPGPPNDAAPEVITSCVAGSSDVAYDVNTGAELGANPCGNNPPGEASIGNTNSNTLDYIPTPKLVSFQEVGVVETIPGSTYLSATSVPPQLAAITINGSQATFSYYGNVVCQASNGSTDSPTYSSYTYVTPYTKTALVPGDLVYPTSISCPSGSGSTSLTLTYPGTIPFSSGLRFKFTGFGAGHYIIGAPGSPFANEREASQSAYAGPTATITSFTPQSTTLSSSSGGPVGISFATTGALSCAVGAASLPAGAGAPALPSVASCNGTATINVPANTNTTTNAVYTVTLTALGVPGTPAANAEITITVPAAPPPPVTSTPPTILGTATEGQTLTESHGSWSNGPTGYSYAWQRCNSVGNSCQAIAGATAQTYKITAADVGRTLRVQETASNVSGAGSPALSSATTVVRSSPSGGTKPGKAPNTRLLYEKINSKRHTATFRFKAIGKSTGFRCALVRRPTRKHAKTPAPKYTKCRSPKTFKHLKAGSYVLRVRAVGPGGVDKTPATYRFKIK